MNTPLNASHPILQQLIQQIQTTRASQGVLAYPEAITRILSRPVLSFAPEANPAASDCAAATHVAFVLDESGSMDKGLNATIEGYNAQLKVVERGAAFAGRTTFGCIRFNSETRYDGFALEIREGTQLPTLNAANYRPDGGTALYDAIGLTIEKLLALPDIDQPNTAVLVTVFTDGDDNVSSRYTPATIKALIERLEATGRWTFALVGPKQTVTGLADTLSVKSSNIAGFDVNSVQDKREAFAKVQAASSKYMAARAVGALNAVDLYSVLPVGGTSTSL